MLKIYTCDRSKCVFYRRGVMTLITANPVLAAFPLEGEGHVEVKH